MEKKYQIFISSTYEDLKKEREKVRDTILSMYQFPIGMEMFSAADEEQWEIIQETIDSSDYYVLIIGHRYGSLIEEGEYTGLSYTHKEFRYALEHKIPILVFVIASNVLVDPNNIEQDSDKKIKLEEFIKEATTGRTVEWWTSKEDLASKVSIALNKQINRGKRPGWIRSDTVNIEDTQKELVEMSKKIRILEKENEELRKSIVTRKPNLTLEINNSTDLKIPYVEYNTNEIDCKYAELSMDDIPVGAENLITQEMLDKFNATLPSKEALDKFKSEWRFYEQATENPFNIDITIYNEGNMKSKDIHIEIQFPDELVLYKKNSEITTPKWPETGKNPIDEYYTKITPGLNMAATVSNFSSMTNKLLDLDVISQINSSQKCFYNEDNSLSIWMDDLMTGYKWNISDRYFIVPREKGTFQIVCSFICEEYDENIEQIIQVVVE